MLNMSAYKSLATATAESLNAMTVKDLRFLSKGLIKGYSMMRKAELVTLLLQEGVEIRKISADVDTKAIAEEVGLVSKSLADYTVTLVEKFKRIVDENVNPSTGEFKQGIHAKLSVINSGVVTFFLMKGYTVQSQLTNLSAIKKALIKGVKAEEGSINHKRLESALKTVFAQFSDAFDEAYKWKADMQKQSLADREGQKSIEVNSSDLIEYATHHLTNLETLAKSEWSKVSVSMAISTGRRPAEIHGSNTKFEVDGDGLMFTGQLKAKGQSKKFYEQKPSYKIPSIVAPELVVAGHEWLRANGKLEEEPKKAHNRFSRYLSEEVKSLAYNLKIDSEKLTFKSLRAIYSDIAVRGVEEDVDGEKAKILGHGRDALLDKDGKINPNRKITDKNTQRAYSADYSVK